MIKQELLFILKKAFEVFFEESDDEEENKKIKSETKLKVEDVKLEDYVEDVVPRFSDQTFKKHFRINVCCFELIVGELYELNLDASCRTGRKSMPMEKKLMITLWYLGNQECIRSIASRFGVSNSNVCRAINSLCYDLIRLNFSKKYIKWPTEEESEETSRYYFEKTHLNGITGSIDCLHIPIRAPIFAAETYVNKKEYYSVLLQGICNHKLEFLHCYAGEIGSINEIQLLRKSGLELKIASGEFSINDNHHLFGDSTYPLKSWLIVPYKDDEKIGEEHRIFNLLHKDCKKSIDKAFGLLKGRFRRLFHIDSLKPMSIAKYIMACCILHNICIKSGDIDEDFIVEFDKDDHNDSANIIESLFGCDKRDILLNTMF